MTTPQPAQPRPRRPRPEVPTLVQLGLKPRTMMLRGLFGTLPGVRWPPHLPPLVHDGRSLPDLLAALRACRGPLDRRDRRQHRVRDGPHADRAGAATTFAMFPDPPPTWPLMSAEVIIAVLGPLVFFPASRTLWTAIDLMMRPLAPRRGRPPVREGRPAARPQATWPARRTPTALSAPPAPSAPRRAPGNISSPAPPLPAACGLRTVVPRDRPGTRRADPAGGPAGPGGASCSVVSSVSSPWSRRSP